MASAHELKERVRNFEWSIYRKRKRLRLKNRDFTIISSNCIGSFMYHDMGLEFLTPTVNLAIPMRDFVRMARDLEWYMGRELEEIVCGETYPCGLLGDVKINFLHYSTFAEAQEKWEKRKRKINWNNLFLVGAERGDYDYDVLRAFDQLSCPNKVLFTKTHYPEFSSAYCMKAFEQQEGLGILTDFKPQFLKRRYMDDFDYVSFLNRGNATHAPDATI